MSQTESKIRLIFEGVERGVASAAARAEAAIKSLDDKNSKLATSASKVEKGLGGVVKGLAGLGAAGNAVSVIGGVAGSIAQLAPAALTLPGALLSVGAAAGTLKLAFSGFGEAVSAVMEGDWKTFDKLVGGMAPKAAEAAKGIGNFVAALRMSVQTDFWGTLSGNMADIGDKSQSLGAIYLPILKGGLGSIAKSFAQMAQQTGNAMKSPLFSGAVESVLYGTGLTIKNMTPALGSFLTGFVRLGAVGTSYLPKLGSAISDVAQKFSNWVDKGVADNSIRDMIDNALRGFKDLGAIVGNVGSIIGSVFKGLGANMSSPLASLRELTTQLADFMKTASAQEGLRALGDMLQTCGQVMRDVLMAALRQLAPLLVDLAPSIKVIAETIGSLLVGAINTAGPILRGIAVVLGEFPGPVAAATTAVVGFVAAMRTIKAINAASEFLGLGKLIGGVGTSAEGAGGKVGVFSGKLGLLKGIGVAAGLMAAASAMDEVNKRSSEGNLSGWNGELHDLQRIMTGDWGNPLADVEAQMNATVRNIQSGNSPVGQFLGWLKRQMTTPLPPINFDVNTGPAVGQVNSFINDVNSRTPQVNINGNANGAGFALREILAEIAAGKSSVMIDGQPMPAQDALKYVVGLINNSVGEVTVNGKTQPAGDAFLAFLRTVQGTTATANLNADPALADETVGGWTRRAEGTSASAILNANPAPADSARAGWATVTSATTGTAHLNAEPGGANATVGGWVGHAGGTVGTAHLAAEPGGANATTAGWKGAGDRTTAQAHLSAEDSAATSVARGFYNSWAGKVITMSIHAITSVFGATGGAVTGGVIVPGFAPGGPVRGAGSGTSDSVPAMLSNGEWVMTADQVRAAGGFAGMRQIASALSSSKGPSPMQASSRAALRPVPSSTSAPARGGAQVTFTGNTSDALATVIMQMVRTGKIQIKAA